jgi:hypothetical protein
VLCRPAPHRVPTGVAQVLYKTAKVFNQRGQGFEKCAENCEAVRQEVEAFKKFVPLVQVGALGRCTGGREGHYGHSRGCSWIFSTPIGTWYRTCGAPWLR